MHSVPPLHVPHVCDAMERPGHFYVLSGTCRSTTLMVLRWA